MKKLQSIMDCQTDGQGMGEDLEPRYPPRHPYK